jgi:hypothetical protein
VTSYGGQAPGQGHRIEDTMSHDKITAAARERMARTGEPYAAARRAIIREHQAAAPPGTQWFEISWSQSRYARFSRRMDSLRFGASPEHWSVAVDADQIRVRMGSFKMNLPRASVQAVERSQAQVGSTIGMHESRGGRWLVNGSPDGLVEITLDPPTYLDRSPVTLFRRSAVHSLTVSLVDPDGFIAALGGNGQA